MPFFDRFRPQQPASTASTFVRDLLQIHREEGLPADEAVEAQLRAEIPRMRLYSCTNPCPPLIWIGDAPPSQCPTCGRTLPAEGLEPPPGFLEKNERDLLAATAHFRFAVGRFHSGDLKSALKSLSRAIELKPNFGDAYYNRSEVRIALGDHAGAVEDCTEAIRIRPDDTDAYVNRGAARAGLGDFEGCLSDTEKALALGYRKPVARLNQGLALLNLGRTKEALAALRDFVRLAPDDPRARQAGAMLGLHDGPE